MRLSVIYVKRRHQYRNLKFLVGYKIKKKSQIDTSILIGLGDNIEDDFKIDIWKTTLKKP